MPPTEEEIRELVRRSLNRLLAETPSTPAGKASQPPAADRRAPGSRLVDEAAVRGQATGSTLAVPAGALVTPLARQVAQERNITLEGPARREQAPDRAGHMSGDRPELAGGATASKTPPQQRVAIGADHGGYALKEALKPHLQSLGYEVTDCGTHSSDAVDYPDIAYAVARLVADGKCANGIVVDGAGIGSCMAANKVPGIRAALCYDHATAVNSREHNHANVLTLGAGLIGVNLAKQIVSDWLATPFGSGRHAKRVEKIMAIEKRYLK